MQRIYREEFPSEGTLYAQIESGWAIQDYIPRQQCVRLFGVTPTSFNDELFNSEGGCSVYVIDLGLAELLQQSADFQLLVMHLLVGNWLEDIAPAFWWKIDYEIAKNPTDSYTYAAFENDEPKYLRIQSIELASGPKVDPIQLTTSGPISIESQKTAPVTLTSFHVGQGMCSLMAGEETGYLIDAGAGTPVSRESYRRGTHADGTTLINDLKAALQDKKLSAIISHPDSDHWRLLDWDPDILNAVETVYLPAGQPALAFSAANIKPKVVGMFDGHFELSLAGGLKIFRSAPTKSDKNGECLVVHAYISEQQALLPGDYVYTRMATDMRSDGALVKMAKQKFDAVVVPHHGDSASASAVPWPRTERAIAFFSAGTHAGYGHPTIASLDAHSSRGFTIVNNHWCRDVLAQRLLP